MVQRCKLWLGPGTAFCWTRAKFLETSSSLRPSNFREISGKCVAFFSRTDTLTLCWVRWLKLQGSCTCMKPEVLKKKEKRIEVAWGTAACALHLGMWGKNRTACTFVLARGRGRISSANNSKARTEHSSEDAFTQPPTCTPRGAFAWGRDPVGSKQRGHHMPWAHACVTGRAHLPHSGAADLA